MIGGPLTQVPFRLPSSLDPRARAVGNDSALEMLYIPDFLDASLADELFSQLRDQLTWRCEQVQLFGHWHAVPRLVSWCGAPGIDYRYAGRPHRCDGWFSALLPIRTCLHEALAARFNFVLLNRYRDGSDAMGWHADNEASLGREPLIASISLGATRRFRVRARSPRPGPATAIDVQHGSLLLAWGSSQRNYQHCLARTRTVVGERINLTFRNVF